MVYTVEFAPEALDQLAALYRYIATAVSGPRLTRRGAEDFTPDTACGTHSATRQSAP